MDWSRSSASCNYFGHETGGGAAEHCGLRCALILTGSLNPPIGSRLRFNVDSQNSVDRYSEPPRPLRVDIQYLEPLIRPNRLGLRALRDQGHEVVLQKIARDLNVDANSLFGRMMSDARDGGPGVPLAHPVSGVVDISLGIAFAEHSVLLRALDRQGGPSSNHR